MPDQSKKSDIWISLFTNVKVIYRTFGMFCVSVEFCEWKIDRKTKNCIGFCEQN